MNVYEFFNFPLWAVYLNMVINKSNAFSFPVGIYLPKVNDRNTRTRCEICSELTIKTPKRRHWCRSGVFIVNFEHFTPYPIVSIVNFNT